MPTAKGSKSEKSRKKGTSEREIAVHLGLPREELSPEQQPTTVSELLRSEFSHVPPESPLVVSRRGRRRRAASSSAPSTLSEPYRLMLTEGVPAGKDNDPQLLLVGEIQRAYPEGKKALESLVLSSGRPNRFFEALQRQLAKCWLAFWLSSGGEKALLGTKRSKYYPLAEKLRMLADELENVNGGPHGSPVLRLVGMLEGIRRNEKDDGRPDSLSRRLRLVRRIENARDLPRRLRDYAAALTGSYLSGVLASMTKKKEKKRHHNIVADQEAELISLIAAETGDPHAEEAATLLEAVREIADSTSELEQKPEKKTVRRRDYEDPLLLRKRWREYVEAGKIPLRLEEDDSDPAESLLAEFFESRGATEPR